MRRASNSVCVSRWPQRQTIKCGFTLVEMLISVSLVLLMMSMFAQIFQIAGDSLSKQRGLAENNQRSRTMQTIFKADLDKRTMRKVLPFAAGEGSGATVGPEVEFNKRRGYFYISENNPTNSLDDKLQFTVQSTISTANKDDSRYVGRSTLITSGGINQPEFDDGYQYANSAGSSTLAEITFFVRNGNLYRRVMLIRDSQATANADPQPVDNSGNLLFDPSSSAANKYPGSATNPTTLWGDFDFSATPAFIDPKVPSPVIDYAKFFGASALENTGSDPLSLGYPYNRFGFNYRTVDTVAPFDNHATPDSGRAKEFNRNDYLWDATDVDYPKNTRFLGAFLSQETADLNFGYPQTACSAPSWTGPTRTNPMSPTTVMPVNRSSDPTAPGLVTDLEGDLANGYARRGEDLLLSNVHAFDVQVWDDGAQAFVNIGSSIAVDYSRSRRLNANYGPIPSADESPSNSYQNNVFDTWHPRCDIGLRDTPKTFIPVTDIQEWTPNTTYTIGNKVFPTVTSLSRPGDLFYYVCTRSDGTFTSGAAEPTWKVTAGSTTKESEVDWQAVDNRPINPPYRPRTAIPVTNLPEWSRNTAYSLGDRVFPRPEGTANTGKERPAGDPFYYVCTRTQDFGGSPSSTSGASDPSWQRIAGLKTPDNEVEWQAVDNRRPLKAIKIELRFVDTSTQQMRQLTLIQSLTDD